MPTRPAPGRSSRKRHWWRWLLAGVAALVVLLVLATGLIVKLQPSAAPLALPRAVAAAPAGPLDGTWGTAAGSVAGFRVQERAVGMSNDVVGRTNAVTGTFVISGGRVTGAAFRIDLTAMKVSGKTQPQFAKSLGAAAHRYATFTLGRPVTLSPGFASGAISTATVSGQLTMNGTSRPVTFTVSGRRNGAALQAAGSIPVPFTRWGIRGPAGYGFLGSLADRGIAEFLFVLRRQ
jgi:polyisoprenoid-binding protein YceI